MKNGKLFCLTIFLFISMCIYSQQLFDDAPLWRQALDGAIICAPSSQAESVVMVSDGGSVKAFSWQGRLLWNYYAQGRLQPFVTRSREGTTYVCRSTNQTNGTLIAINRMGRELWQINLGEPLSAEIMIGWDGRLFVFTTRHIRCYTASGYLLWSKPLEKTIAVKPHQDGEGGFVLVYADGEFLRVNSFGRIISEKLNTIPIAIIPVNYPQANNNTQNKSLLFLYPNGTLELHNPVNGEKKILDILLPALPHSLCGWGDHAAILLRNGAVCYVSISEQRLLWTGSTHLRANDFSASSLETNFFYDERGIYLLTQNGGISFTEDGERLWTIELRGAVALPAFSDEGVLYSGGSNWILYAYQLEQRIRAQTRVLYGPAPEGSYGIGIPRPDLWSANGQNYSEGLMTRMLGEIENAIREGNIGEREIEYATWLMEISGSSLGVPGANSLPGNPRPGYQSSIMVMQKIEAIRLLSYMGSSETIPFLANLFTRDTDPLVKAAAAQAIGRIGTDPEGIAIRAFSNAIFPPAPLRDERALTAVASACGALCRFSGPPLAEACIRIITALLSYDMPPAVRNAAERELKSLLD